MNPSIIGADAIRSDSPADPTSAGQCQHQAATSPPIIGEGVIPSTTQSQPFMALELAAALGSSAPQVPMSAPVKTIAPAATRPCTWLQGGIHKPKVYTDGTVQYGCIVATSGEPQTITDALADENWKQAMDSEFHGLLKIKLGT
jgi:hypothetical protein